MFGIGAPELVLILIVALVIFGPSKLPSVGSAFGKGIRDFRAALREAEEVPARQAPAAAETEPGSPARPAPEITAASGSQPRS